MSALYIVLAVIVFFVFVTGIRSIRLVPQARAVIVQRLGRYLKTAGAGPVFVVPFIDQILPTIDLREGLRRTIEQSGRENLVGSAL